MKIEVRPPDGVMIIGEQCKECMMFHLYCEDALENGFNIILTNEQILDLKKSLNRRSDIEG